jgi:hypothetical protein
LGLDFPVVWVCLPEEDQRTDAADDRPSGMPWPLTAVEMVEETESFEAKAS